MSMSPAQLKLARYALGLPNKQNRSYRNRYFAAHGTEQEELWDNLVDLGMARKMADAATSAYFLTRAGALAAVDPDEALCPEDFPSPPSS